MAYENIFQDYDYKISLKKLFLKQSFWADLFYLFAILTVFLLPFPLALFPIHQSLVNLLFKDVLSFITQNIFQVNLLKNAEISSDSILLYFLVLFIWGAACVISIIFQLWGKWQKWRSKALYLFQLILAYYLAFQLLNYGIDKIFKAQFYLPEPNILYTNFGYLDKDILFWSVMGLSYPYNLFMGIAEVLPALLIFYRKTRILGFLLSFAVLLNVVAINFSFDISVKVYSSFLCFLSILLLSPYFQKLYRFFILKQVVNLEDTPIKFSFIQSKPLKVGLKSFTIGLILIECFLPFLKSLNFNDDLAPRPYLHGAYEVTEVFVENKKISINQSPIKRFYIHRRNFLIFETHQGQMADYELFINQIQHVFLLKDYQQNTYTLNYKYNKTEQTLWLEYPMGNKTFWLQAKALDWQKLPALQENFHWAID